MKEKRKEKKKKKREKGTKSIMLNPKKLYLFFLLLNKIVLSIIN